jgi:hypothetical protein
MAASKGMKVAPTYAYLADPDQSLSRAGADGRSYVARLESSRLSKDDLFHLYRILYWSSL